MTSPSLFRFQLDYNALHNLFDLASEVLTEDDAIYTIIIDLEAHGISIALKDDEVCCIPLFESGSPETNYQTSLARIEELEKELICLNEEVEQNVKIIERLRDEREKLTEHLQGDTR